MDLKLLWTIQLAPLAAFILIVFAPKFLRKFAPLLAIGLALTAAIAALKLLILHGNGSSLPMEYTHAWLEVSKQKLWPFVEISDYSLSVGFLLDPLNLLMITVVTSITFFVQLFSFYYMVEDESRWRYFAFLSFFSFAMTGLVLSNNLLQTFLFWELVGLASYLLIGFWYQKPAAATAARKAFVINRLADLGFYLGIIMLFLLFGTVNFLSLERAALLKALPEGTLMMLGLLIFMGVMGKSAQFPFHVWLPDAMEGPTPVSALIHSATMVAAGVFLLSRNFGLFSTSETTLQVILIAGSLTALTGAFLATIQRDIKKILAYSTVSQLGLMVMAIGAGSFVSGMFHLTTHAYFKSLLFLTSGAFIHRFHTNDIFEIGSQGGKKEYLSLAALGFGLASLCGIFPFAGFFSKDLILETLRHHHLFFYGIAILVSFLTVYYSFRLFFIIYFSKIHESHHEKHHESPILKICMAVPLIVLAAISIVAGLKGTSVYNFQLLHWLGGEETQLNMEILITTTGLILGGGIIAFLQFRNPEAAEKKLREARGPLFAILDRKFFIDDAYEFMVKKVGLVFASGLDWFDRKFINGVLVNQTSYFILNIGRWVSRLQSGLLQDYLAWAMLAGVAALFWIITLTTRSL